MSQRCYTVAEKIRKLGISNTSSSISEIKENTKAVFFGSFVGFILFRPEPWTEDPTIIVVRGCSNVAVDPPERPKTPKLHREWGEKQV